jgi:hypothetical protein
MTTISEPEFARIVNGIIEDREIIIKHNPVGTDEEVLLWMLLGCLISFLNLSDQETPCFPGTPTADTYKEAIRFVVSSRSMGTFDVDRYLAAVSAASANLG